MEENKQPTEVTEETKDSVKEPVKEPVEEKTEENTLALEIEKIKTAYEEKITKIVAEKDAKIKEQSEVITQLVTDGKTAKPPITIADMINNKRDFKKW